MIPSSETGRSVYQIDMTAADPNEATDIVAAIFCPDPDHVGPCPVPWENGRNEAPGSLNFVFYATEDQAQEILAKVNTLGYSEVALFRSVGADGQPIDGSAVVEQFRMERS